MKFSAMLATLTLLATTSLDAHAGDRNQGEHLAKQWCTSCHLTSTDQASGGDAAPPFPLIAESAADRSDDLSAWLADPHPPMPNFNLTRREIDDLLAYIESLKAD